MTELDSRVLEDVVHSGPQPLFATVSGAHLYGFSSADSDVDLRGAFVLPLREVLRLRTPPETLTITRVQTGMEIDWVAHDLTKFARLMTRRNGYVLEQLYSPLVVYGGPWLDELRTIGRGFITRHLYHHYRGFLWNQLKLLKRPEATVKDLLYAYRVVLTGIHLLTTGEVEANLHTLNAQDRQDGVEELIARKRSGAEHGMLGPHDLETHNPRLEALEQRLNNAFDSSRLLDAPATMDQLEDYVVRARVALGTHAKVSAQV
ncbi:MAG: nucleotidyltransferase domain-containing protein [Candidatus Xenobia bacterium]